MKKTIVTTLFLLLHNAIFCQDFELGKVTIKELQQKQHPIDTSAVAAILFKKAHTVFKYADDYGFETSTEFKMKLKIYKKAGLTYANLKIPFYVGYKNLENESVKIESAYSYCLENNIIIKTKVTAEGKFENKENENWGNKIITFPNVKEGSILEIKYILKSQNLMTLPDFQFQYDIPVDKAVLMTEIPENYLYNCFKSGLVEVSKKEVYENASQSFEDRYRSTNFLNYNQIKAIYTVSDVPAIHLEPQIKYSDNFYGTINHELQTIRYPNQEPKQISTTWNDVSKYMFESTDFGKELLKSDYFAFDMSNVLQKESTNVEKLNAVYNFVKNKMTWNGKNSIYTRRKLEDCYSESSGNSAEINLILIAMLQKAGFNVTPVLSSTRSNGFAAFPNTTRLNYVIALVKLDENAIVLDATCKFCATNILPTRVLNFNGICLSKNDIPSEISLIPQVNSIKSSTVYAQIAENALVKGKFRTTNSGQYAVDFDEDNNVQNDSYLTKVEKYFNLNQIDNYERIVSKNSITENFDFISSNLVEVIGKQFFLNPLLFFTDSKNPYNLEKRRYPVDFVFPKTKKTTILIEIPSSYEVQTMPKSTLITFGNDLGSFAFNIGLQGNQIQISTTYCMNTDSVDAVDYENLKEFYKKLIEKQNEKIVLKKI